MKYLKFCLIAVVALSIAAAGSLASANLLVNPGFEDPITFDGPPFEGFWEGFSAGGVSSAINGVTSPLSGLQTLELEIAGGANLFAGAFQAVRAAGGAEVTWSGNTLDAGADPNGHEIRIEWFDAGGGGLGATPNSTPALTAGVYTPWSLTATAPAGTHTARVVYAIQSFGAGPSQLHYVDDVSATKIPEPTSLALMGMAGLAIATMRRRK